MNKTINYQSRIAHQNNKDEITKKIQELAAKVGSITKREYVIHPITGQLCERR